MVCFLQISRCLRDSRRRLHMHECPVSCVENNPGYMPNNEFSLLDLSALSIGAIVRDQVHIHQVQITRI